MVILIFDYLIKLCHRNIVKRFEQFHWSDVLIGYKHSSYTNTKSHQSSDIQVYRLCNHIDIIPMPLSTLHWRGNGILLCCCMKTVIWNWNTEILDGEIAIQSSGGSYQDSDPVGLYLKMIFFSFSFFIPSICLGSQPSRASSQHQIKYSQTQNFHIFPFKSRIESSFIGK